MFAIFRLSRFGSKLRVNDLPNQSDMTSVMFKIETMVEEIKLLLTFKDEFEYGDISIKTASFAITGQSAFRIREQNHLFFNRILLHKVSAVNWDFDGTNQDCK